MTRPESGDPNGCPATCPLMRPKARAYSHQGHGREPIKQAGYISATSAHPPNSLAISSRSIHLGHDQAVDRSVAGRLCPQERPSVVLVHAPRCHLHSTGRDRGNRRRTLGRFRGTVLMCRSFTLKRLHNHTSVNSASRASQRQDFLALKEGRPARLLGASALTQSQDASGQRMSMLGTWLRSSVALVSAEDRARLEAMVAERGRAQNTWGGPGSSSWATGCTSRRSPGGPGSAGRRCGAGSGGSLAGVDRLLRAATQARPPGWTLPACVAKCAELQRAAGEATHWTGRAMAKVVAISCARYSGSGPATVCSRTASNL